MSAESRLTDVFRINVRHGLITESSAASLYADVMEALEWDMGVDYTDPNWRELELQAALKIIRGESDD